ncbi:MAG: TylF/MycF family methyltransferase [Candidatus Saccharibacteria bacterium]|nr:TylF/MycF family methyltransferase [Candidatus Saccharibacteria bacterium]
MKDLQISTRETDVILAQLAKTIKLPGDVVEFGCYAGDTSVLLAEALKQAPDKWLYLYDSFEGLPEKTIEDQTAAGWRFKAGELKVSPETVAHKFKKLSLPEPVIVKKWFNQLDNSDLPSQISFALLDGDFYASIKTSFEKVAPLLTPGGIIVVHDFRNAELPGVAKAVNEFLDANSGYYDFQLISGLAVLVKK